MYNFRVEIDMSPFTDYQGEYKENTERKCKELIEDISEEMVQGAKDILITNGNYKTGKLHDSIKYKIDSTGYKVNINVGEAHAIFIEGGTKAHIIKPKRATCLRFMIAGKYVYAKKVHHPGTKAKPFLSTSMERSIPYFISRLEDAISEHN